MVTKGMWRVATDTKKNQSYCFGVYSGDLHIANMIDQDGTTIEGRAESWENVQLIVTAVNQCKSINPSNPQAVAEQIGEMYRALSNLDNEMETIIDLLKDAGIETDAIGYQKRQITEVLAKCERKEKLNER